MSLVYTTALTLSFLLYSVLPCGGADRLSRDLIPIVPNVAIQQQLLAMESAKTAGEILAKMGDVLDLVKSLGADFKGVEFVHQLMFYAIQDTPNREFRLNLCSSILNLEFMRIIEVGQDDVVRACAPFLDSNDVRLRKVADLFISVMNIYQPDYQAVQGFGGVKSYLTAPSPPPQSPPIQLLDRMFSSRPLDAFHEINLIYLDPVQVADEAAKEATTQERNALSSLASRLWKARQLSPEHVDEKVIEELRAMSESPRWWARIYTAKLMDRYAPLRDEKLIQQLRNDSHSLVRQFATEAQEKFIGEAQREKP